MTYAVVYGRAMTETQWTETMHQANANTGLLDQPLGLLIFFALLGLIVLGMAVSAVTLPRTMSAPRP